MGDKQIQNIAIREAKPKDVPLLQVMSLALRQEKEPDYFEQLFMHQLQDGRLILIFSVEGEDAGYVVLNWTPKYGFFRKMRIPEIQDLNVLPDFRQRGIATWVIRHCEGLAAQKGCEYMGISFALHPGAGPAQKLYIKLGYQPDGNGVTYDRKPVARGEFRAVDEDLCLMLVKNLKNKG